MPGTSPQAGGLRRSLSVWQAIGIYFVLVTAVEMMGFGTTKAGVTAFASSPSLLGDLGTSYVGAWVGDVITLGATVSAFGCCLASTVGVVVVAPGFARRLGAALTAREGIAAAEPATAPSAGPATDPARDQATGA